MCFTTDPAWSRSSFLTALSPSDVSVVVWSSLIYMFFIIWVMAFTVKYGMWTCDCCKAADVNGSRVGPLWLFTFLWEVNKNGVLTGTWMKGAVSAVYCCYAVLKKTGELRNSVCVKMPFCWAASWDSTCGKKNVTEEVIFHQVEREIRRFALMSSF